MTKQRLRKLFHRSERGQAIILIAFAIIGLVAMVGLVTDTGILLIEYGKLKRGVDAAAISAAQQYRLNGSVLDQVALENAAKNFLQLNQATGIVSISVHSCEDVVVADRPDLCNPDPVGQPNENRKLVEVAATKSVTFGFLRVIGLQGTTLSASSVGEAATIDLVMIIDTSASMAYETDPLGNPTSSDPGDDPHLCNQTDTCQPLKAVKDVALDFLDTLYFPYDRVSIITMTGQQTPYNGTRNPVEVLPLNSNKATITAAINGLKVFEPRICDGSDTDGLCLNYDGGGTFIASICQIYENHSSEETADPSSCPSSNVGGVLNQARGAFTEDPATTRLDAFWVVVALLGGPANASDVTVPFPNGYCPPNTFLLAYGQGPWCRDRYPGVRHDDSDPLFSYTNPHPSYTGPAVDISLYDADDYARDMADNLATLTSGDGVTIFTIGLGAQIRSTCTSSEVSAAGYVCPVSSGGDGVTLKVPAAENLLQYIAECAGDSCGNTINHGQYFYAPTSTSLAEIFDRIAKNIATRISQ
jgi:Flp pilus assembly protein TadG